MKLSKLVDILARWSWASAEIWGYFHDSVITFGYPCPT